MPRYEYRCEANGRTVEVTHPMADTLTTWGEVCARAEVNPGKTPGDAPVERLISLSHVGGTAPSHSHAHGAGCGMPGCCRAG